MEFKWTFLNLSCHLSINQKLSSEVCILVHYIEFGIITTQRRDFLKQCCIPLIWLTIWLGLDCLNNLNIICRVSICIHIYIHNVQLMNTNLTWFVSSYHEWNMEGNYFLWYDEPYEKSAFYLSSIPRFSRHQNAHYPFHRLYGICNVWTIRHYQ